MVFYPCFFFIFSPCFFFFNVFQSLPYFILSIILLYYKVSVSRMYWSCSTRASCVAATGAKTSLYRFAILFLIQLAMVIIRSLFEYCRFVEKSSAFIYLHKPAPITIGIQKWVRKISLTQYCFAFLALLTSAIFIDVFVTPVSNAVLIPCTST